MADLICATDWRNTAVGSIHQWPDLLLSTVNMLLASQQPMFLWWGEELTQFYNDAYRPSLGIASPRAPPPAAPKTSFPAPYPSIRGV